MSRPLTIRKGVCYALYVYDVGLSIDLEECKRIMIAAGPDGKMQQNRRAPKYFDYHPTPVMIAQEITATRIAGCSTTTTVDLVLYDFGAVTVTYTIPFDGSLENVRCLSCELYGSTLLQADSRKRVETLLEAARGAVGKPHEPDLCEDYAMFQVEDFETLCPADELHMHYAEDIAQILRAENQPLSEQEIADALLCRISFGRNDVTLIDWNAALIFDRDAEDVRAVLEFANIELLEMRFLDRQLDDSLDRSYEMVANRKWQERGRGISGGDAGLVAQMQMDGAILFERVSNALKLSGDQYLARVYRLASQRFHLSEWNAAILRKLDTIESIYTQLQDRAASWRLELLEWIIIVLIAVELVIPFLPRTIVPWLR